MKHYLRIFALLTALLILLSLSVSAQDTDPVLEQAIIDGCLYGQTVDLSAYSLSHDSFDALFSRLLEQGRLPWFTTSAYSYRYNERTGYIVDFTPENTDPAQYDRTLYEQKLAEVMDACILDGMRPEQIALSVHDYLILNNIYDESLESNTGYDLLVRGTTVCAGYTSLYMDILNRAGIPCVSVTSEPMEHTWNLVQIDGSWYHVDVTWDDPTPDSYGHVEHEYFLLTDTQIAAGEEPHYDWVTDITCTDTRFSDAYWRQIDSAICFESSAVSYLIRDEDWNNRICRRDEQTGEETVLYTDTEHYVNTGSGEYAYVHRGLSLRDGRLFFGTQDQIRSMTTDGKDVKTEYRYDTRSNRKFIYGFTLKGSTASITVADHDFGTQSLSAEIPGGNIHTHSFTETVQAATCELAGYTASVCDCGLTCQSEHTPATGHSYKQISGKKATLFAAGFSREECESCGNVTEQALPKLVFIDWLKENFRTVALVVLAVITLLVRIGQAKKRKG